MKQLNELKNMKLISRETCIKALQGKLVSLIGLVHIPYDSNDWDDVHLNERVVTQLQKLEVQIATYCAQKHTYDHMGLFKATSNGYKRGNSGHVWQKGDYCLTYLGVYVIVTGHVIMLFRAV